MAAPAPLHVNEKKGFDTFKQLLHALNDANAELAELEDELAARSEELAGLDADAAALRTKEGLFFKLSRWVDGDAPLSAEQHDSDSDDVGDSAPTRPPHVAAAGDAAEGSSGFDATFAQLSEAKQRIWRLKRAIGRKTRRCETAVLDISALRSRVALDGASSTDGSKHVTVLVNGKVVKMTRDDARCAARDKVLKDKGGAALEGESDRSAESRPRQSRIDKVKAAVAGRVRGAQLAVVSHRRDVITVAAQSAEELTVQVGSGSCVCFEFEVQQPDGVDFLRVDVGFLLRQQRAPLVRWTDDELKRELAHAVRHKQYALAASVAEVLEQKHRAAHSKLERAVAEGDYETAARLARFLDGTATARLDTRAAGDAVDGGVIATVPAGADELVDVAWEGMLQSPPDEGSDVVVPTRYGENEAVNGFWGPACHPTTLHFCFDNTYSLMREKVVAYEIMVLADHGTGPVDDTAGTSAATGTDAASCEVDGQLTLQGIATSSFSAAKQKKVRAALAAATKSDVDSVRLLPASAAPTPELGVKVRFVISVDSLRRAESLRAELQLPNFVQTFSQHLEEQAANSAKARRASRASKVAAAHGAKI